MKGDSLAAFREALARIEREIEQVVPAVMPRALLVLYFSGHADGINLEFGRELLPFDEFRELVRGSAASVKIAFVDSCQSGGLTSTKGGRPAPAFDLVVTDHLDASGTVVLTSSAAGENSQESGQIQGSFFTHYLLSGLRGAADHNRDSRVTLAEVYQYAYDRTVVETARTLAGTRVFLNCCGEHSMSIDVVENVYVVTETDDPEMTEIDPLRSRLWSRCWHSSATAYQNSLDRP